jgi:hypothetical protein
MASVANGFVYVEVVDRFMKKFVLIHNCPPLANLFYPIQKYLNIFKKFFVGDVILLIA